MPSACDAIPYETRFAELLAQVEAALARFLQPEAQALSYDGVPIAGPERLWEAMRYAALAPGKRIRPVLTLAVCRACGGELADALPTACAIEMVHAQSLVHDDLPCMDDDDLRRGQPTVHRAFDEATAVLAGDALLAMAFGVITRHTPLNERVSPPVLLALMTDLSDVSSVNGLVNGQFADIYYENRPFDAPALDYIHTYKTGALFRFAARSGARLAGADAVRLETFSRFGQCLGLAFQIVDDLLDVESSAGAMGKTVGKDAAQGKATYPALYGVETSRQKARALTDEALALLQGANLPDESALRTLTTFMTERLH